MTNTPNDNDTQPNQPKKSLILNAYTTHISALKRFASRLLGNQHDVEDIVQEAFLRAYKAEGSKQIDHPKSYLFRVTKHVALNQIQKKTRKPTDYLEDLPSSDVLYNEPTLEEEIMAQEKLEIHCAAVATLPPQCRKVYLMRKVYGMSYKEIAKTLGITVSTVETHIEKGFARCSDYVESKMNTYQKNHTNKRPSTGGVKP